MPISTYPFAVPIVVGDSSASVAVSAADPEGRCVEITGGTGADVVALESSNDNGTSWQEIARQPGGGTSRLLGKDDDHPNGNEPGLLYRATRIAGTTALVMKMLAPDVLLAAAATVRYSFTVPALNASSVAVNVSAADARGRTFYFDGGTGSDTVAIESSADGGTSWLEIGRISGSNKLTVTHAGISYRITRVAGSTAGLTFSMEQVSLRTGAASQVLNGGNAGAMTIGSTDSSLTLIANNTAFATDDGTTTTIGRVTAAASVTINAGENGTIAVGTSAHAHNIDIGTGAAVQDIAIGSLTGATRCVINSGSAGLSVTTSNGPISIESGTGAIGLGNGATAKAVTVGSLTGASSLALQAGSGGLTVNTASQNGAIGIESGTGTIGIGAGAQARSINIGTGAATQAITIGNTTGSTVIKANAPLGLGVNVSGGSNPDASAVLQADSTTRGFLPPRMTGAQRGAISSPAEGLTVYDLTARKLFVYTTAWEQVTSA